MPSGRREKDEMTNARKAIADIITYHKDKIKFIGGKPSPKGVADLVKEYYGITITRQSVTKILADGSYGKHVDTLCLEDNPKIIAIKDAMMMQQGIWKDKENAPKDRTMSTNSWRALQKQLIDYENSLADLEIQKKEASRPIYLIRFKPPSVDIICPKCGHNWYDIRDSDEKKDTKKEVKRIKNEQDVRGDEWKPFYNADAKEQKSLSDFKEDDKEEFNDEFSKKDKKTDFKVVVETTSK